MASFSTHRGERCCLSGFRDGHHLLHQKSSLIWSIKCSQCDWMMFEILKKRWAILRSYAFYDIITHWCIISACCMPHNLIKNETPIDAMEEEIKNDRI